MIKGLKTFLWVLIVAHALSCSQQERIDSMPKDIRSIDDDYVFVQGRWKATARNSGSYVPAEVNTVSITCDKDLMTCREAFAELVTATEQPLLETKQLWIHAKTYKIVGWSDGIIDAKYEAPVADFVLKISLKDNFAERSWRETKARGSETANPSLYCQWVLE